MTMNIDKYTIEQKRDIASFFRRLYEEEQFGEFIYNCKKIGPRRMADLIEPDTLDLSPLLRLADWLEDTEDNKTIIIPADTARYLAQQIRQTCGVQQ